MRQSRRSPISGANSRAVLLRHRRLSLERLEERSLLASSTAKGLLLPPISIIVPAPDAILETSPLELQALDLLDSPNAGNLQAAPTLLSIGTKNLAPVPEESGLGTDLPPDDDDDTGTTSEGRAGVQSITEEDEGGSQEPIGNAVPESGLESLRVDHLELTPPRPPVIPESYPAPGEGTRLSPPRSDGASHPPPVRPPVSSPPLPGANQTPPTDSPRQDNPRPNNPPNPPPRTPDSAPPLGRNAPPAEASAPGRKEKELPGEPSDSRPAALENSRVGRNTTQGTASGAAISRAFLPEAETSVTWFLTPARFSPGTWQDRPRTADDLISGPSRSPGLNSTLARVTGEAAEPAEATPPLGRSLKSAAPLAILAAGPVEASRSDSGLPGQNHLSSVILRGSELGGLLLLESVAGPMLALRQSRSLLADGQEAAADFGDLSEQFEALARHDSEGVGGLVDAAALEWALGRAETDDSALQGLLSSSPGAVLRTGSAGPNSAQGGSLMEEQRTPWGLLFSPALFAFATPRRAAGTILLVEHDEPTRDAIHEVLALQGYLVLAAGTAHDAWGILQTPLAPIDLVLLDLHLPDVSGLMLYARLRESHPYLPVVLCTRGDFDLGEWAQFRDFETPLYLRKPVGRDRLLATVQSFLS